MYVGTFVNSNGTIKLNWTWFIHLKLQIRHYNFTISYCSQNKLVNELHRALQLEINLYSTTKK